MLALNLATFLLGSLAAPVVVLLFISAAILSMTWKRPQKQTPQKRDKNSNRDSTGTGKDSPSIKRSGACESGEDIKASTSEMDSGENEDSPYLGPKVTRSGNIGSKDISGDGTQSKAGQTGKTGLEEDDGGDDLTSESSSVSFGPVETITVDPSPANVPKDDSARSIRGSRTREGGGGGGSGAGHRREDRRNTRLKAMELKTLRAREQSNLVFVVLLLAYFVVITCKYPLILIILSPLALWALLRHAYSLSPPLEPRVRNITSSFVALWKEKAWLITPPPLPTLFRMYLYADSTVLGLAIRSTGSLVSLFIIFGLVVGVVLGVFFLLLQVQVELAHYMTVGAKVWNLTLTRNPQISE